MTGTQNREATLEGIAFVGEALSPFFLQDPRTGIAQASFEAFATLDAHAAAAEWPFAQTEAANEALSLMVEGLASSRAADGSFEADDNLMWEYRRLFIGPGIKPAPPWGSVYTDRECVVFGLTCLDLRAWMREHGIERTTDDRTPEDHIGLLLALMAYLARNQEEDLDDFLRLHVLTWSAHFLDQLTDAAEHPFYKGLAMLTNASLAGIQQALDLHVDYPRFYR